MAIPSPDSLRPVLSMGEILIDFIVADGATSLETAKSLAARAGGAPANASVALSRLGVPAAFCGVVGDDPFGNRLRRELTAEGVDASRLRQTRDAATTFAYAWKDSRGDGHFWLLRGADTLLDQNDVESAGIDRLSALVVGSVSLAARPSRDAIEAAVARAHASGVPVVFDVNLRPTLWPELAAARPICEAIARQSRLVKLSLDDARGLFGDECTPENAIRRVQALSSGWVVLTDGERGCWFSADSAAPIDVMPAFAVDAIEPTGAGDAFSAALIARLIDSSWTPPTLDDVRYASAAGALATTRHGAWEGLPDRNQLNQFLADHRS
jgi:sugar/nucleoside kinase (ribokinase family)